MEPSCLKRAVRNVNQTRSEIANIEQTNSPRAAKPGLYSVVVQRCGGLDCILLHTETSSVSVNSDVREEPGIFQGKSCSGSPPSFLLYSSFHLLATSFRLGQY